MCKKPFFPLWFVSIIFAVHGAGAQQNDLSFYLNAAYLHNPALQENLKLQQYNGLQNELTYAQLKKPLINLSADYQLSPFFFDEGRLISITPEPDAKAIGYDAALSNGGLYAAQLNASLPLLTNTILNAFTRQNQTQNLVLQQLNLQIRHDLDKTVTEQFIAAYQSQQQIQYLKKIIALLDDRRRIVEALVQKGLMQQNDFLLLKIEILQNEYAVQQQEMNVSAAINQLNNTCGIRDTALIGLAAPEIAQSQPLQQFSFQQKYALDSANLMAQQAVFNTRFKPQLLAFGNAGYLSSNIKTLPYNMGFSAGLHLSIPLYDGHQKNIGESQNQLLLENMQQYRNQNAIEVQNNLAALQQQINFTQQSVSLLDAQLSAQETLLQIIKEKVVSGQISVTDYLSAVQNYAGANQNKIQTQTSLWLLINQYNYVNW